MDNRRQFHDLMKSEADRKLQLKEAIREELARGEIPVPDELLHAVEKLFVTDAIEVLRAHTGYALEDKIRSLRTVLQLFDQTLIDLEHALADFGEFSRQPEFSYRSHKERLVSIETRVRKETFAFSELSHTLQDHCRRLRQSWEIPGIADQISKSFGSDGLHEFLCGLRNALHHQTLIEADWLIRNSGQSESTHFIFSREELIAATEWNVKARGYLEACGAQVDIEAVAHVYNLRAHAFYDWLLHQAANAPPLEVIDYRRCWSAHRAYNARMAWRFLLDQFLKRNIDPYLYLDRYLKPVEMEAALKLPQRSRQQVDFIIGAVDKTSARDDEITDLVYQLFKVAE